jgi:hypothetical protein
MTKLERYEEIIQNEGIEEKITDCLPDGVEGACVIAEDLSAIFLNKGEIDTNAKRLEVLSHEKCHLSQGALYRIDSSGKKVYDAERKATIASYRELLPFDYVLDAVFKRKLTIAEISFEEEVPCDYVYGAIGWYSNFEEFVKAKGSIFDSEQRFEENDSDFCG